MLATALVACALALRLLVPQGWMPVADAHGLRITMCSGSGAMDMPTAMPGMAMHHGPGEHGGGDHAPQPMQDHPCTFAHLGLALAEPVLTSLVPPPPGRLDAPPPLSQAVTVGRGLAAPPPPATGPPLLV